MIKKMKSLFRDHPSSVGETYLQHFKYAFCSGCQLFLAGLFCILHACFPFLHTTSASSRVEALHKKFQERRSRHAR
jgi:hypothetical protein